MTNQITLSTLHNTIQSINDLSKVNLDNIENLVNASKDVVKEGAVENVNETWSVLKKIHKTTWSVLGIFGTFVGYLFTSKKSLTDEEINKIKREAFIAGKKKGVKDTMKENNIDDLNGILDDDSDDE